MDANMKRIMQMASQFNEADMNVVREFNKYEDYLDSLITEEDHFYLEDDEIARRLIELGYRTSGDVLKREEFDTLKRAAELQRLAGRIKRKLASANKEIEDPFLVALAEREEANMNHMILSILYIRLKTSRGEEVSSYIDYAHRMMVDDFEPYFAGKKRLLPRPTDLSYCSWGSNGCVHNNTPNFEVLLNSAEGMSFLCKLDHKTIAIEPNAPQVGKESVRVDIFSPIYGQTVIFDHIVGQKYF